MLTLLHTNDFHGALDERRVDFIRGLKSPDSVYFDSGDCIKAGNLAIPLRPETAWELLDKAGCDASTLGNRETHVLESAFRAKLEGVRHPIVCANLKRKDGSLVFPAHVVLQRAGLRVGVIGVMVPMVTERMASRHASAFLWDQPIPAASAEAERLRKEVDCLIAITHIGHKQDLTLASSCPYFDLVLGGHSHTVLERPERIGDTFVCQGGSHGRFLGRYVWAGKGNLAEAELLPFG